MRKRKITNLGINFSTSRNTINYKIWSRNVLFSLHPDVLLHLGTLYYEGKWGEKIEKKDRLTQSYLGRKLCRTAWVREK